MSGAEMSRRLGFEKCTIGRWMRLTGLTISRKQQEKLRLEACLAIQKAPRPEDEIIKLLYLEFPVKVLAELIGRSGTFVQTSLARQGLKIPRSIIKQRIQDARIQSDHTPKNKGLKQKDYMSAAQIKKTKATRFKKGHIPVNAIGIKDGDIRIRHIAADRGRRSYKYIRLAMGKWQELHRYNWEKAHGAVPKGQIVVFRNGDTMNCSVKNLKLISNAEHAANTRDTDGYIAMTMSHKKGRRGLFDRKLYNKLLNEKELLDLKRTQIKLKRTINERKANTVD